MLSAGVSYRFDGILYGHWEVHISAEHQTQNRSVANCGIGFDVAWNLRASNPGVTVTVQIEYQHLALESHLHAFHNPPPDLDGVVYSDSKMLPPAARVLILAET